MAQFYATEIISEYVIRNNNAILKCSIPAFVTDYVSVMNWIDSEDHVYEMGAMGKCYMLILRKNIIRYGGSPS